MFNGSLSSIAAAFAFVNSAFTLPTTDLLAQSNHRPQETLPRLVQYVQTFHPENSENGHLSLLPLVNEGTGITHVILAALHINGPNGDITLNDDSPNSTVYDRTWSEVSTLQDRGVEVMVMMGGAATGSYNGRLCEKGTGAIQDEYYLPLVSTLKYHNLDGLDLDIEEAVPAACPGNLVQRVRADFGDDFIITMAPVASGFTGAGSVGGFSYKLFEQSSAGKQLDFYNGQFYNGFVRGSIEDSYEAAVNSGFDPSRVVVAVSDNPHDASGYVRLADVKEIAANLKAQYSDFGGMNSWEYFDAGSAEGLSQPWMWVKQIGQALFGSSSQSALGRRSFEKHTPPLPSSVATLMAEGHDQIAAARAMRLARGDEAAARNMLKRS